MKGQGSSCIDIRGRADGIGMWLDTFPGILFIETIRSVECHCVGRFSRMNVTFTKSRACSKMMRPKIVLALKFMHFDHGTFLVAVLIKNTLSL